MAANTNEKVRYLKASFIGHPIAYNIRYYS